MDLAHCKMCVNVLAQIDVDLVYYKMCVNVLAQIDVDLVYYKMCVKMCWPRCVKMCWLCPIGPGPLQNVC